MQKLRALTGLRFFAAAAIVFLHFEGYFGIKKIGNLAFGVSFFFILSGFILTYVYSALEDWEAKKKFYLARVARIWPAHLFFFLVVFFSVFFNLIPTIGDSKVILFNIFMVHAWIPLSKSYFSFNSPSWSISTEFFFYLCFPFIISNWSKTWYWKAFAIGMIPFCIIWCCTYFHLPHYTLDNALTTNGLLHVNPLSRLFEFFLGIVAAKIWLKYRHKLNVSIAQATFLELAVISLLVLNFLNYASISSFFSHYVPESLNYGFNDWAKTGIFESLSFSLLIMIFALEKGIVSKLLSNRAAVFLGEISFSIYLFHQIIFRYYIAYIQLFQGISNKYLLLGYWSILLLGAALVWKFIECPSRK